MTKKNADTRDLAELVASKINSAKVNSPIPSQAVLEVLFQTLFYASLKTEESEFIKVTVTLISKATPDPNPPEHIVKNRWRFSRFEDDIPLSVKSLVKLCKAADPWSSTLAVDFDENNELFIWGMVDQAVHYQSFLHYEVEAGPEQPGIFQASVTDIGTIVVIFDYELIATLKQNTLISNYPDVLKRGELFEQLKICMKQYRAEILETLKKQFPDELTQWRPCINDFWTQILARLLIRIQAYHHGGAFLITNTHSDLDIKYKINYDRIGRSVVNYVKIMIEHSHYDNVIFQNHIQEDEMPVKLYLDAVVSESTKGETYDELKGAIRFVASLSCVDGLVVLSPDLTVQGFGGVIQNITLPRWIYVSRTAAIQFDKLTELNPDHFGTRHRSMFSYCWKYPGSIGFVVSQDGDIRAILRVKDKLIMWENIRVQQLSRSDKLKRKISK